MKALFHFDHCVLVSQLVLLIYKNSYISRLNKDLLYYTHIYTELANSYI